MPQLLLFITMVKNGSNRSGLSWNSGGFIRFVTEVGGSQINTDSAAWTPATDGTWYHIEVTRSSGDMYFFVDGVEYASASPTNAADISLFTDVFLL